MSGSGGSERVLSRDEFMQMAAASTAAKAKRGRRSEPVVPPPSERWERRHRAQSFIQGKELDELEVEVETGLYENVDLSYGSRMPVLLAHICFSERHMLYGALLDSYTVSMCPCYIVQNPTFLQSGIYIQTLSAVLL